MKFKKNLLIVLIIMATVIWTFNFFSLASLAETLTYPSELSNYSDYFAFNWAGTYNLFATNGTPGANQMWYDSSSGYSSSFAFKRWTSSDGITWTAHSDMTFYDQFRGATPVVSTFTIYNRDMSVFFQPPPRLMTLEEVAEEAPFMMTLSNILAGLTPVLGLVISVTAFKKGWAFLRGQLTT